MEKFTTCSSIVVPFPRKDVDTDLIIPAQYLTSVSREGYGQNLFRRLRDQDPNFPLNQERYQGAKILLADDNFGCGSSREHAVWALMGYGFRVLVGKSFADIFSSNSAKNGLLLVTLQPNEVDQLFALAQKAVLTLSVDLDQQKVSSGEGREFSFTYDPFRRHCLLNGLDDIDYIRSHGAVIEQFRERQKPYRFYSTTEAN